MNTVENALLKQMQKISASISAMQSASGKDKGNQAAVSFQEMLQQSGGKSPSEAAGKTSKESMDKPLDEVEQPEELEQPTLPVKDKEELKAENLTGNPNAVGVMDLFRPEIVETAEAVEPVLDPIPQETVEGPALDLGEQTFEMESGVDTEVGTEVSMEQQPRDFQQAMEEPTQETVNNAPVQQAAPERRTEQAERPEQELPEVEVVQDDETTEEAPAVEQPVFHETQSVPVKVGERYEVVDTQQPEMDDQLANVIRSAAQTGQEHVEIRLNPQNLGSLVIEMTKDTNGVLQVVLHASTPKAEGLLNQHLSGLHTALQGYGQEEVRLEVQRNDQSEQQHFRQADPDGRGQHQNRQQQERHEEQTGGEEFMQKLRLGLFGAED